MARVKRGTTKLKHRRNVLARTKGFRFGLKSKERAANEALAHAGNHAFAHRRDKKNVMRRDFTVRINAALRPLGLSYSKFIDALKKKGAVIDRKILAELATDHPESFERLVKGL